MKIEATWIRLKIGYSDYVYVQLSYDELQVGSAPSDRIRLMKIVVVSLLDRLMFATTTTHN